MGLHLLRAGFLRLWWVRAAPVRYSTGFRCEVHELQPTGFRSCGSRALQRWLNSCGTPAQLLCCLWAIPGPEVKPVSPALQGRVPTTGPEGKPLVGWLLMDPSWMMQFHWKVFIQNVKQIAFRFPLQTADLCCVKTMWRLLYMLRREGCVRPISSDTSIPQGCSLPVNLRGLWFCFSFLLASSAHYLAFSHWEGVHRVQIWTERMRV